MTNQTEDIEAPRAGSYSIEQWCRHRGISVSFFYKLRKAGTAPATQKIGRRRVVTFEADEIWAAADVISSKAADQSASATV